MSSHVDAIIVDDPDAPRLADYRALTDSELRQRYESQAGVFIAEGPNVVRALLASAYVTRSLLLTPKQMDDLSDVLDAVTAPIYVGPQSLLEQVVGFHLHRGALAVGERRADPSVASVLRDARVVAVLEKVNDHENLGALFRNARALGVDAVLLDPECADPYYRRAVRVSMGHLLHVPWTRLPALPAGLDPLHAAGFESVALTPDPSVASIEELVALGPVRLALLVGAEGPGLSEATMRAASRRVRIPMAPGVDSLNVATAAAIAFHRLCAR
jgi:tRNA G18 (ribose-2'-O)-methylase SpoU